MVRLFFIALMAVMALGGCTATEFNQGVDEGVEDVRGVIRGTN